MPASKTRVAAMASGVVSTPSRLRRRLHDHTRDRAQATSASTTARAANLYMAASSRTRSPATSSSRSSSTESSALDSRVFISTGSTHIDHVFSAKRRHKSNTLASFAGMSDAAFRVLSDTPFTHRTSRTHVFSRSSVSTRISCSPCHVITHSIVAYVIDRSGG